jgi:hypothetical protein
MHRAAAAVLTVAGLVLVLVAVMGAVVLGPRGEWRAQGLVSEGARAVVVGPSLAAVLGPRVALRVEAEDDTAPLFVGRARPDDARALVAGTASAEVVGLDGSRRLEVRSSRATGALPPPGRVDLWQQTAEGTGSARLAWTPSPGAQSLVVARADGAPLPAVDLTVSWRDAGWRLLPVGALASGAALLLAAWPLRRGRRGRPDRAWTEGTR